MPTFFWFQYIKKGSLKEPFACVKLRKQVASPDGPPMTESFAYLSRNGISSLAGFEPASPFILIGMFHYTTRLFLKPLDFTAERFYE